MVSHIDGGFSICYCVGDGYMLLPDTTSTRDAAENGREARDDRNLPAMCRLANRWIWMIWMIYI